MVVLFLLDDRGNRGHGQRVDVTQCVELMGQVRTTLSTATVVATIALRPHRPVISPSTRPPRPHSQ